MKMFWTLVVCAVIQGSLDVHAEDLLQEDIDKIFNRRQNQDDLDFSDKSMDKKIQIQSRGQEVNTPIDENLNSISEEDKIPERPSFRNMRGGDDDDDAVAIIQVSGKSVLGDDDYSDPGDDMETAETIVFRPLFRYRKKSIAKKRVYKDSTGQVYAKPSFVSDAPVTYKKSPPAILVYDRVTGGYYPVKSYNN